MTNIYDITVGGVSFLHTNEKKLSDSELQMDILIFDSQTNFEYFIGPINGRITSKEQVPHPKSKSLVWRYGVEFFNLDVLNRNKLATFCSPEGAKNFLALSKRLSKISYDS